MENISVSVNIRYVFSNNVPQPNISYCNIPQSKTVVKKCNRILTIRQQMQKYFIKIYFDIELNVILCLKYRTKHENLHSFSALERCSEKKKLLRGTKLFQ